MFSPCNCRSSWGIRVIWGSRKRVWWASTRSRRIGEHTWCSLCTRHSARGTSRKITEASRVSLTIYSIFFLLLQFTRMSTVIENDVFTLCFFPLKVICRNRFCSCKTRYPRRWFTTGPPASSYPKSSCNGFRTPSTSRTLFCLPSRLSCPPWCCSVTSTRPSTPSKWYRRKKKWKWRFVGFFFFKFKILISDSTCIYWYSLPEKSN